MKLLNTDIQEYQRLCKARLGTEINREEAAAELTDLVGMMRLAYQPITVDEFDQLQLRRVELGLPGDLKGDSPYARPRGGKQ